MSNRTSSQAESTVASALALEILSSDVKIPPMPAVGSKIIDMAQKPIGDIDIAEFCKIIEPDPGLHSRVLQLANSPYYRGVDEVIGLRSAITRIGLQEAVNSANFYFLQRFLPNIKNLRGVSAKEYWAFSWAFAAAGRRLGHPNISMEALPGELYISGLLQGTGKLILAIYRSDTFSSCIEDSKKFKMPLHNVILEKFGTTDSIIAAKLMETWHIPARICAAVEFCHNPGAAPEEYRELAALTQLAYCIASTSEVGTSGDGILMDTDSVWLSKWTQNPLSKKEFREKTVEEILTYLDEKSESVTGLPSAGRVSQENTQKKSSKKKDNGNAVKNEPQPGKEKGLWGWIKSLFG